MPRGVIATVYCKEGTAPEVIRIVKEDLLPPTRKEVKNTFYHIYQNPEDPDVVLVVEMYEDDAAIDDHMAASYFGETIGKIEQFFAKPPYLARYNVLA